MESALSALQAAVGPDCRGGTQARWTQGVCGENKVVGKEGREEKGSEGKETEGTIPGRLLPRGWPLQMT